ncbi:MAG: hypothetical protein GY796_34255 [Chloroflexi bacterium]|nr:hypothetical protein [Chloroflexota bacterium]
MPMFKPIQWKTFPRDFLIIQIGFVIFGLSIALLIRGNLGTGAWGVLEVGLSERLGVSPGSVTVASGFVVLSGVLIMREKIGWGTLANILSIGPWLDLALTFIPSVESNLVLQFAMLLTGIGLMGCASAVYIGVDAGAGPRDSLMLAIKRTTGVSIRVARMFIEVTVVMAGWLLGGPAGIGTVIVALLIGPSVQLGFRMFQVEPHKSH